MYDLVYSLFIKWGLAVKLPEPQWQDAEGNQVPKEEALGSQVECQLTYPDRVLTMDESGGGGNQADETATRGNKVYGERDGPKPAQGKSTEDTSWTIQGFTTLSGKAVLFVIII